MKTPVSLLEATRMFSDAQKAHDYFVKLRWPDGVVPCPECKNTSHYYLSARRVWKCKECGKQFSVKVGTIFEKSPLTLDKWLIALWLITNAKNGISSCEVARSLEVTQKTAWFMLHRIRMAMKNGSFERLVDDVEVDETYIGGKARNMPAHKRAKQVTGRGAGGSGKAVVMGMLERGGDVRTVHIAKPSKKTLQGIIRNNVLKGSRVHTDALKSYEGLSREFMHGVVDHTLAYVEGSVHTNGLENYWSLLKRTIRGTYVSVEPFHLHRYLDEQSFRYNERRLSDGERFAVVGSQVSGKRLTYRTLTGKELAAAA